MIDLSYDGISISLSSDWFNMDLIRNWIGNLIGNFKKKFFFQKQIFKEKFPFLHLHVILGTTVASLRSMISLTNLRKEINT